MWETRPHCGSIVECEGPKGFCQFTSISLWPWDNILNLIPVVQAHHKREIHYKHNSAICNDLCMVLKVKHMNKYDKELSNHQIKMIKMNCFINYSQSKSFCHISKGFTKLKQHVQCIKIWNIFFQYSKQYQ